MVYEAVCLFGVLFAAEGIALLVTRGWTVPATGHWNEIYFFIVLGIYFTYFWGHGGQTLPMQTWRIKITTVDQQPITFRQAILRYCAAWMWLIPAVVINYQLKVHSIGNFAALLSIGMIGWALTSKLDKNGQFLHDRLAGTCLITIPKPAKDDDHEPD